MKEIQKKIQKKFKRRNYERNSKETINTYINRIKHSNAFVFSSEKEIAFSVATDCYLLSVNTLNSYLAANNIEV